MSNVLSPRCASNKPLRRAFTALICCCSGAFTEGSLVTLESYVNHKSLNFSARVPALDGTLLITLATLAIVMDDLN